MRELRRRRSSGFEDQDVLEGVREVILTADDVADAQVGIVGTRRQVIGRHAVGTQEREVFDVSGGFHLLAVNGVGKANFSAVTWDAEPQREGFAGCGAAIALFFRHVAGVGIEEPGALRTGLLGVTGVRGREVTISVALIEDSLCDATMKIEPLGLLVFFVPVETEPAQAFEDGVDRRFGIALNVGVVEAEDHGAAIPPRIKPIEDESARTAHMKKAGGRRRESDT